MKATLPKIKFCGFTRPEDIQAALDLGIRSIGINFYPKSKRYVQPSVAVRLLEPFIATRPLLASSTEVSGSSSKRFPTPRFPTPRFIGVFVDATPEEVLGTVRLCSLDGIQLHGDEDPSWIDSARRLAGWIDVPILRALPYRGSIDDALIQEWSSLVCSDSSPVSGLLIDAYDPIHKGGTGKRVAWELLTPRPASFLPRVVADVPMGSDGSVVDGLGVPFLLAGGLNPENVKDAMKLVMPLGVDVASGIESEPGIKDLGKMKSFIQSYREGLAGQKTPMQGEQS